MANTPFTIQQEIFLEEHPEILVESCHLGAIKSLLPGFLSSVKDNIVGMASIHGRRKCISRLVLSTRNRVLIIDMSSAHWQKNKDILRKFLLDKTIIKSAFEMDKLAAALHIDFLLHINNAKDLLSLAVTKSGRHSLDAVMYALGGETTLSKRAVINIFEHEERATIEPKAAALQAWAACRACTIPFVACRLDNVIPIYTTSIDPRILTLISKTIREGDRILALKPTRVKHDFDSSVKSNLKSGTITVTSKRYKTRMMYTAANQFVRIDAVQADGTVTVSRGRTKHVQGKTVKLSIAGGIGNTKIQSLHTIGRESPTSAEILRTHCMLEALQQTIMLSTHPFINVMWFPNVNAKALWKDTTRLSGTPSISFPGDRKLNASQLKAVKISLSSKNSDRVILIHGPPGTGKTTVIAATVTSVMSLSENDRTLWLVAQSNVAVKNIAEKLASVDFVDFKVLVSKDFHFDWHEHLYRKIDHNVLRSDDFAKDIVGASRQLLGSRVILCTLSMLSNDTIRAFTHIVPIQTVIFDEASQIEIGDYLPMLIRFRPTLRKLIFIGDNKQLAPYGSNDIPTLHSIFEKSHMLKRAVFLDTQYRMPIPIGEFISKHVYCGKLQSQHTITSTSSCRFVDVCDGVEASQGHSWVNLREVAVVIKIAGQLTRVGKSFRIITPYDPQRSILEKRLKDAALPWEDKCFNIDAFQGNEDDYIIISLVRSEKLGFLTDERRVNVMLTRCKMGMIICSSRMFLQGPAVDTLVGKMFAKFGHSNLVEGVRVLRGEVQPFD